VGESSTGERLSNQGRGKRKEKGLSKQTTWSSSFIPAKNNQIRNAKGKEGMENRPAREAPSPLKSQKTDAGPHGVKELGGVAWDQRVVGGKKNNG